MLFTSFFIESFRNNFLSHVIHIVLVSCVKSCLFLQSCSVYLIKPKIVCLTNLYKNYISYRKNFTHAFGGSCTVLINIGIVLIIERTQVKRKITLNFVFYCFKMRFHFQYYRSNNFESTLKIRKEK